MNTELSSEHFLYLELCTKLSKKLKKVWYMLVLTKVSSDNPIGLTPSIMITNTVPDQEHISTKRSLQPLYNMVHYNTVLDKTRFKYWSQKCIDDIEK